MIIIVTDDNDNRAAVCLANVTKFRKGSYGGTMFYFIGMDQLHVKESFDDVIELISLADRQNEITASGG